MTAADADKSDILHPELHTPSDADGVYQSGRRTTGIAPGHALLFAPAVVIFCYGFLRSMVLALLRGGILWRGTLYSLSELRRATRRP